MPDLHMSDSMSELPLDRYLAGEATPAQSARIEAWLAADPVRARLLTELRQAGEGPFPQVDLQALGARIEERIDALDASGPANRASEGWRGRLGQRLGGHPAVRGWAPLALGLVVAVAMGYGYMYRAGRVVSPQGVGEVTQRYTTDARQRATITLTDGSRVTLAPQTTLTLASGFGSTSRRVTVDGEAYFVVAHAAGAPFLVSAGSAVAQVLGTTFVVRKFSSDTAARVIVAEGKVAVRSTRSAKQNDVQGVLTASTMAVVSDSGIVTLMSGIPVNNYIAWTDGRLVFRDTPLREAIDDLTRAYGVTIVADSLLLKRQITLTAITSERSLTEVLDVLVTIIDAHYTKDGNVVTIRPGRRTMRGNIREKLTPAHPTEEKHYGR